LHRNEEVFQEPEMWRPERWLEATQDERDEMARWFWAFGSGGRMCIGNNLAVIGEWKRDFHYVSPIFRSKVSTDLSIRAEACCGCNIYELHDENYR
jgi:hypothetical protein